MNTIPRLEGLIEAPPSARPRRHAGVTARMGRIGMVCRRWWIVAGIVGPVTLLVGPARVQAELIACRSDPVVILSNAVTIDFLTTIHTAGRDVEAVSYTVHVPQGTQTLLKILTKGLIGQKENVQVISDAPARTYTETLLVTSSPDAVPLTADLTIVALGHLPATSEQRGVTGQVITQTITLPAS